MSLKISIFNKRAYREYTLTSYFRSEDKRLCLDASFYWIEENLELLLESADGQWILRRDEAYVLLRYSTRTPCEEDILLCDGMSFYIDTLEGERLRGYVSAAKESMVPYSKYEVSDKDASFSIGTEEDNDIYYCPKETFRASSHLEWARASISGDDLYIDPLAREGIYINGQAARERTILKPGDELRIYGMSLYAMRHQGKFLFAIYCSYGRCIVVTDALSMFLQAAPKGDPTAYKSNYEPAAFRRSPRELSHIETGKVVIEAPPDLDHSEEIRFFQAVGSSLLMVMPMIAGCAIMLIASRASGYQTSLFMYSGLVMAAASAIVGVIWGITNVKNQKKQRENARQQRFLAYSRYLIRKKEEIEEKYEKNMAAMFLLYPAISEVAGYNRTTPGLWDRNENHDDFLEIRIGLGDVPFQVEIEIPKEKFHLYEDELRDKPEYIKRNFETLYDVPQTVSLRKQHIIGLVGGEEKYGSYEVARNMILRLAATHCYTDVKMVFLYDESSVSDRREWDFVRLLPHTWSENRKMRFVASTPAEISEVCYFLAGVFRKRLEEEKTAEDKGPVLPYYILFLSDPSLIEGELIAGYIFRSAKRAGVTAVILSEVYEDLPNGTSCFIENTEHFSGINNLFVGGKKISVRFDETELGACRDFAANIANIRVKGENAIGEIPDSITFLEMYGAGSVDELGVEERWLKNKVFENIRGKLGVKGEGAPVYLDVHEKYHGPHGLVAGTTGSGKSETLQTYLLSLAVNYSPDDVSFFIIDYKGGGMANLFDGLPHLAGSISNLSGSQINRAMVSIKAENRRRQRLFNEANVNNINSYTRLYKSGALSETLPHLFIIIDEFAELKREEPDFMQELISVAQVGRSLGVHLILSTQKPSGTVDDNIWSNSRFKLCLRVQTKEDSMEMLGKPDAAYINQAGRCYLEVGNDEMYELFQSGYSGAVYDPLSTDKKESCAIVNHIGEEEVSLSFADSDKDNKINRLDAVIDYIRGEAERLEIAGAHQLWMPILGNPIYLEDFSEYRDTAFCESTGRYQRSPFKENGEWEISAVIGRTDDPKNQSQDPLVFSLSEGHTAIVGTALSGKSTLLTTILYSLANTYTPDALNFYCLDYSAKMLLALKELPHTGGVLCDGEEVQAARLFNMLMEMLDERKKLFMGGNYAEYVRANGVVAPAIIVAIDNFASFNERNKERYMSELIRIGKEGIANGIFLLLTGAAFNMNEIPGRLSATIGKSYCLALADKYAYGDILHTIHVDLMPETGYKGRGLAYVGERILEYQAALALPAEDDYARNERIREKAAKINSLWSGKRARTVPQIPDEPTWEIFRENEDVKEAFATDNILPVGYKSTNAAIYGTDIYNDYCYMIAGMPRTGKTSLLRLMIYSALEKENAKVILIDAGNRFSDIENDRMRRISSEEELYEYCLQELTPLFKERNARKRALL